LIISFKNKVLSKKNPVNKNKITDTTYHPEKGSGSVYEELSRLIRKNKKSKFLFNSTIERINHSESRINSVVVKNLKTGKIKKVLGSDFISTIPITEVIEKLNPPAPKEINGISKELYYRDLILVNLVVNLDNPVKYSFLNIYSPRIKALRITNFEYLSEKMGNGSSNKPICVEYNCFRKDKIWKMKDSEILEFAKWELERIGFCERKNVVGGFVKRIENAYPVHSIGFRGKVNKIRMYLSRFENLQSIGRNGMFMYNQMRHSVESGLKSARNVLGGNYDIEEISFTDEGKDVLD